MLRDYISLLSCVYSLSPIRKQAIVRDKEYKNIQRVIALVLMTNILSLQGSVKLTKHEWLFINSILMTILICLGKKIFPYENVQI